MEINFDVRINHWTAAKIIIRPRQGPDRKTAVDRAVMVDIYDIDSPLPIRYHSYTAKRALSVLSKALSAEEVDQVYQAILKQGWTFEKQVSVV